MLLSQCQTVLRPNGCAKFNVIWNNKNLKSFLQASAVSADLLLAYSTANTWNSIPDRINYSISQHFHLWYKDCPLNTRLTVHHMLLAYRLKWIVNASITNYPRRTNGRLPWWVFSAHFYALGLVTFVHVALHSYCRHKATSNSHNNGNTYMDCSFNILCGGVDPTHHSRNVCAAG